MKIGDFYVKSVAVAQQSAIAFADQVFDELTKSGPVLWHEVRAGGGIYGFLRDSRFARVEDGAWFFANRRLISDHAHSPLAVLMIGKEAQL